MNRLMQNNRGIALLIVLLVTALLIALVFEFAYGTRVSLRAAMNYRDSQRAHYLARSGVGYVWWNLVNMPDNLVHGEWQVVPIVSTGDTEVRVRWEDEGGKIRINSVTENAPVYKWLSQLFTDLEINQEILDIMADADHQNFRLLGELHHIMSDEDFRKTEQMLTVYSTLNNQVNINTAPYEVLRSLFGSQGISESDVLAEDVVAMRRKEPFENPQDLKNVKDDAPTGIFEFKKDSKTSRIYSFATVGDYTKQVEAVIRRADGKFQIVYWRVL